MSSHPDWNAYPVPANLPPPIINDPALPLVSIVTPSYNQGQFIRETIESVLGQEYPNLEYWVIDGGSTDQTLEVLREYSNDPRLHWISEPDRGQADAVNKGWVRCRGDILGWLNSDDTYLPGAVQAQVEVFRNHPNVGVVYGDTWYTNADGRIVGRYDTRAFIPARLLHHPAIPQPSAFVRRDLIAAHGLLDPLLRYALDFELFVRLLWQTEFCYNRQPIATYRLHQTSKTVHDYTRHINEARAVVWQSSHSYAHRLPRHTRQQATSDWCWLGALLALERKDYAMTLAYALAALRIWPLRPRMAMVGLKVVDEVLHTRLHWWAYRGLQHIATMLPSLPSRL